MRGFFICAYKKPQLVKCSLKLIQSLLYLLYSNTFLFVLKGNYFTRIKNQITAALTRLKKTAALPMSLALLESLWRLTEIRSTVASTEEFNNSTMMMSKMLAIIRACSIAVWPRYIANGISIVLKITSCLKASSCLKAAKVPATEYVNALAKRLMPVLPL